MDDLPADANPTPTQQADTKEALVDIFLKLREQDQKLTATRERMMFIGALLFGALFLCMGVFIIQSLGYRIVLQPKNADVCTRADFTMPIGTQTITEKICKTDGNDMHCNREDPSESTLHCHGTRDFKVCELAQDANGDKTQTELNSKTQKTTTINAPAPPDPSKSSESRRVVIHPPIQSDIDGKPTQSTDNKQSRTCTFGKHAMDFLIYIFNLEAPELLVLFLDALGVVVCSVGCCRAAQAFIKIFR